MKKWFVIHSIESYCQHENLIGMNSQKKKNFDIFRQIRKGDLIIYYAVGKLIIGIFEVVSSLKSLRNDRYWGNTNIYKIKPVLLAINPPSIVGLVKSSEFKLELFKDTKNWSSYLQGKTIIKLSENDFRLIKNYIEKSNTFWNL
jgi:hypothetical protein